jgi:hypothetical protein
VVILKVAQLLSDKVKTTIQINLIKVFIVF